MDLALTPAMILLPMMLSSHWQRSPPLWRAGGMASSSLVLAPSSPPRISVLASSAEIKHALPV